MTNNNIKKYLESSLDSLVDKETEEKMVKNIEDTVNNKYPLDHKITKDDIDDLIKLELLDKRMYTEIKAFICF